MSTEPSDAHYWHQDAHDDRQFRGGGLTRQKEEPGGLRPRPVELHAVTSPKPIQYKGEELQAERGPGLGCFRFQLVVLAIFVVLTPLSVLWDWPDWLSAALLFSVILLLLVAGQTIIFLLRLVAADRRTRRRPLGSATKTVGEIEDDAQVELPVEAQAPDPDPSDEGPVQQ